MWSVLVEFVTCVGKAISNWHVMSFGYSFFLHLKPTRVRYVEKMENPLFYHGHRGSECLEQGLHMEEEKTRTEKGEFELKQMQSRFNSGTGKVMQDHGQHSRIMME